MRGVHGKRGSSCLKEGRNLNLSGGKVLLLSNSIMVGMDRYRDSNSKFVANAIDQHGNIPEVHRAIGFCASFRFCNLDNNRGIGPLGGHQDTPDDKLISAVCS